MKIIELQAENIKRLKAIHITPNGSVVPITGRNRQGKSSVLDSIWFALGGEKAVQDKPVRDGEKSAWVKLDMGEFTVTRSFNEAGNSYLHIEHSDGFKMSSPQKTLDKLLGGSAGQRKLAFDPLEFMRMTGDKQAELLKKIVDIPLDGDKLRELSGFDGSMLPSDPIERIEAIISSLMETRKDAKKSAQDITARLDALVVQVGNEQDNIKPVKVSELFEKRQSMEKENNDRDESKQEWQENKQSIIDQEQKADGLMKEADELLKQVDEAKIAQVEFKKQIIAMPVHSIDTISEISTQISQADETNKIASLVTQKSDLAEEFISAEEDIETSDNRITAVRSYQRDLISQANMPIDGLSFSNGIVTYNDLPLSQAADSEQLQVSLCIAMASNPKVRVVRIKDGSLLDAESMTVLAKVADEHDNQIWIERVKDEPGEGFYILDGEVAEVNE